MFLHQEPVSPAVSIGKRVGKKVPRTAWRKPADVGQVAQLPQLPDGRVDRDDAHIPCVVTGGVTPPIPQPAPRLDQKPAKQFAIRRRRPADAVSVAAR